MTGTPLPKDFPVACVCGHDLVSGYWFCKRDVPNVFTGYQVVCFTCARETPLYLNLDHAIAEWNRRTRLILLIQPKTG